jgi:hypothetical protein
MTKTWACSISYKDGCSSEVVFQKLFNSESEARAYGDSQLKALSQKNPYILVYKVPKKRTILGFFSSRQ